MTDHSNTTGPTHLGATRMVEIALPQTMAEVPPFLRSLAAAWRSHGSALANELAGAMLAGNVMGTFSAGIGTGLTQLVVPVLEATAASIETEQAKAAEAEAQAWERTSAAMAGLDAAIAQAQAEGTPFGQAFAAELRGVERPEGAGEAGPWWVRGQVYGMTGAVIDGTCRLDVQDPTHPEQTHHLTVDFRHLGLGSLVDYLNNAQATGTDAYLILDLGNRADRFMVTGYANPVSPGIHAQAERDTAALCAWLVAPEADETPAHGITRPGEYGNSESHL